MRIVQYGMLRRDFSLSSPWYSLCQIPVANRTVQLDSRTRLYKPIAYPIAILVVGWAST
jgi:hypothetical protein